MTIEANVIATVDVALFTLREGRLCVVLLRRQNQPYKGRLALPGGYIHVDEDGDALETARRVLRQKTGLVSPYLEQLYTFSGAFRDRRGWSLSVCYYALVPEGSLVPAPGVEIELVPADDIPALPFDHNLIVATAIERLRGKSTYSSLPAFLLPALFTLTELQEVYEKVLGLRLDKATFRAKIEAQGIVEPAQGMKRGGAHRPAQLYRLAAQGLTEFERKI
jgi:ADP-ribose pyrophosphatase YjhB (NUDIX family)